MVNNGYPIFRSMFYFILEMVFFLALLVVSFLFLYRLPLVDGFEEEKPSTGSVPFFAQKHWRLVDLADRKFFFYLTRLLHRIKVLIMKSEVLVSNLLERVTSRANEGGSETSHIIKTLDDDRQPLQQGGDVDDRGEKKE